VPKIFLKATGQLLESGWSRGADMIKTPLEKGEHVLISRPHTAPNNLTDPYEEVEVEFTVRSYGLNKRVHLPMEARRFPPLVINGVKWQTTEYGWYRSECYLYKMDVHRQQESWEPKPHYVLTFLDRREKIKVTSLRKALAHAPLIAEDIIQNLYIHMVEESARQKPFRPKMRVKAQSSRLDQVE
jgi:hypothetical protein